MFKRIVSLSLVGMLLFSAIMLGTSTQTSAMVTDPEPEKISICHRTNAVKNPYVQQEVSVNAVDGLAGNSGNEADHYGEHKGPLASSEAVAQALKDDKIEWGDIIPPVEGVHDGLNWTEEGQSIYENDCNYVDSEVASVEVTLNITPANCEVGAKLTYSYEAAGASLVEGSTDSGVFGPQAYSISFLANEGLYFAETEGAVVSEDGTTLTVSGDLAGPLDATSEACVLGEETPEEPVVPGVLPNTSAPSPATVMSVLAGVTAAIALVGATLRATLYKGL